MHIFELIDNENFFKPFVSKNRELYFDCICELIKKSKGRPVLYDDDARDCLNLYLNNCKIEYVEEQDDSGNIYATKDGASILRYFRECGWLSEKELGRNGNYETHVTAYCRRIIEYLKNLADKNSEGVLSNRILAMHDILKDIFNNDSSLRLIKPYENILKPLVDNMETLKEELFDLNENISTIMMKAMDSQNMKSFGSFMLKDDLLERFFSDYFFIKNNGTISIILGDIHGYIRRLNSEDWITKISENYMDKKNLDISEAQADIQNIIYDLQFFISNEYQEYIDQIEKQINNYYSLAHSKMMMFQKNGINLEAALDEILRVSKSMEKDKQDEMFTRIGDCITLNSQKYIGVKSFANKKRRRKEEKEQEILEDNVSEQELDDLTDQVMMSSNRYSVKKAMEFLDNKFMGKDHIELKNEVIHDASEALMYASIITMSEVDGFDYDVEVYDDEIDYDFVKISNIQIKKRGDQ